jgi:transcriptional regulator with XRE-family HTH domain
VIPPLGRVLAEVRRERGLSQEELGHRTGVHRNYIGGIERGERSPSVETIAVLADELEVSLGELFARAESR